MTLIVLLCFHNNLQYTFFGIRFAFPHIKRSFPSRQKSHMPRYLFSLSFCYPQKIADVFHPYQNPFCPGINLLKPPCSCSKCLSTNHLPPVQKVLFSCSVISGDHLHHVSYLSPPLQLPLTFHCALFFFLAWAGLGGKEKISYNSTNFTKIIFKKYIFYFLCISVFSHTAQDSFCCIVSEVSRGEQHAQTEREEGRPSVQLWNLPATPGGEWVWVCVSTSFSLLEGFFVS